MRQPRDDAHLISEVSGDCIGRSLTRKKGQAPAYRRDLPAAFAVVERPEDANHRHRTDRVWDERGDGDPYEVDRQRQDDQGQ